MDDESSPEMDQTDVVCPCSHCKFLGKSVEASKRCQKCNDNLCTNCVFTHSPTHRLVALDTGTLSRESFSRLTDSRQNSLLSRNSFISNHSQELSFPSSRAGSVMSTRQSTTVSSPRTLVNTKRRRSLPVNRRSSSSSLTQRTSAPNLRRMSSQGVATECIIHGQPLEAFCVDHDSLCCEDCINFSHGSCDNVIPIDEAAQGIRESSTKAELEEKMESQRVHCQQLKKDREGVLENLALQDKKFVKAVSDFKKKISQCLDEFEAAILKEKEMLVDSEAMEGQSQVKTCETAIGVLDSAARQLENAAIGEDEQLFVAVKSVSLTLQKCNSVIYGMDSQGAGGISFDFQPNLELEFQESLGELNIHSSYLHNKDGAKRLWILKPQGEFNIKMANDTGICNMTGSIALKNGRFVFADETNRCIRVVGPDQKPLARIALSSFPWDVCSVSENTVAVTLPKVPCVQIICLEGKIKIESTLELKHACRGIAHYNENLYLTCSTHGAPHLKVITTDGVHVRKIQPKKGILYDPHYVKIDESGETLFVSDWKKGVVALDQKGYLIFTCQHPQAVAYWGLVVDKFDQIYISSKDPNGVCRVDKEKGKLVTLQIWPETRPMTFLTMAYSATSDTLLVSVDGPTGDTIRTFKIS